MTVSKSVGKREFIQHTSKYLKWIEKHGSEILITHHNHPSLLLTKIKCKSLKDLRGSVVIKIYGDINEPVLPGYDEW